MQMPQMPDVVTEMSDPGLNFTFAVRAYRRLTDEEIRHAYAMWRGQKKANTPKRNQRVEVLSFLGDPNG